MRRADELTLLEELIALRHAKQPFLDENSNNSPVDSYLDSDIFNAETQHIFLRTPQVIAHTSELSTNNSFLRRTVNRLPLLLLKGDDGEIRTFLNVCRHRGTRLVDDQNGCKRSHSCPYHAWTWNSRGEFINGPHFELGFADLDKKSLNLKPVRSLVRYGFVWLLPHDTDSTQESEKACDRNQYFSDLDSELIWAGTENLEVHESTVQLRHCNWKILVEGGIESYHFKVAHRNTIAPLFNDNLSSYQCLGPHIRSILPRNSIDELTDLPHEKWHIRDHANVLLTLFPNNSLLIQSDHVIWIAMMPLSVDQCEVRMVTLRPRDSTQPKAYWDKNHQLTVATLSEDFDLAESIQSGLHSGANETLQFGRFEGALHRFNETVRAYLSDNTILKSGN